MTNTQTNSIAGNVKDKKDIQPDFYEELKRDKLKKEQDREQDLKDFAHKVSKSIIIFIIPILFIILLFAKGFRLEGLANCTSTTIFSLISCYVGALISKCAF